MTFQPNTSLAKLKQMVSWFDTHGLFVLSTFLIAFIPLFPKIPLFDILPGYIVRARPEDLLIFFTAIIWIKDARKKRFPVNTTYFWLVVCYAVSGAISILLGTLLLQSIPAQLLHIGKSSLHLFRYLEYFALFFFTYSSVKTEKQLKLILTVLAISIFAIVIYGIGQEYLHFPLYSTMNREYSKGVTLYLQAGARPQSTFAGHYDLAAYLVIVLPIIFSFALNTLHINLRNLQQTVTQKSTLVSIFFHFVHILGAWMLVTSGSKTALFAYIVATSLVLIAYLQKLGSIKLQLKWGSLAFITVALALTLFLNFFAQTTREKFVSLLKTTLSSSDLPANPDATPDDLVGDGYVFKQITIKNDDGTTTKEWIQEKSTWSHNALKYGLSMGIRLDTLWPNALKGFINNPLFGNGYATLVSISSPGEYSTAESTDNNFLRTLGETGIFGFIIFYGLILVIATELYSLKTEDTSLAQALKIGFLGSIVGILINATYIDVFAASKVAYTFWAFAGVSCAILQPKPRASLKLIFRAISQHWPLYLTIVIAFFFLHQNPFHEYALIKNLDVSDQQIELLTSAKCYIQTGSFTVCNASGQVLKEKLHIYSALLVPFYKLHDNPAMFYFLNLFLTTVILIVLYVSFPCILKKCTQQKVKQVLLFSSLLLYVLIATALNFSNKPLTTLDLGLFMILLPGLLLLYTLLIHTIQYQLAYFTQICAVLFALLFLMNANFKVTFLNQFRNTKISDKYSVINLTNVHIDMHTYLNREKEYYILTTLNPYYVDLFSNKHYRALPLSDFQSYVPVANKVYGDLINSEQPLLDQYKNLVESRNIYATDYGTQTKQEFSSAFQKLKNTFDLSYVAIGCADTCSLYKLSPESEKTSPQPLSISDQKLIPSNLQDSYSFSVFSNRFEPKTEIDGLSAQGYSTENFASLLEESVPQTDAFTIVTGDLYTDNNPKSDALFKGIFNRTPILYTAGNTDLNENKFHSSPDTYFYTDSEFFIFLNVHEDSTISQGQQLFLYNALLQIEKLPTTKNIFIISHNLNWEDRSDPNNFIFELEKKLSQFPKLQKFIITSHHTQESDPLLQRSELSAKHITDPQTNTQYFSSFVRDWENDSFFEFIVNQDNTVNVQYRVSRENL